MTKAGVESQRAAAPAGLRARVARPAGVRWRWTAGAALAVVLLTGRTAWVQEVTEPSLKAAYLYNFARLTEWRSGALPSGAPLTACVMNDLPVREALIRAVKGRSVSGREIHVLPVQPGGSLQGCHLLYMAGVTPAQGAAIVRAINGSPVLTVSELDSFARKGGVIHLFVRNGKLNFDIDLNLARKSGLQLNSRLLALAEQVYEQPAEDQP